MFLSPTVAFPFYPLPNFSISFLTYTIGFIFYLECLVFDIAACKMIICSSSPT